MFDRNYEDEDARAMLVCMDVLRELEQDLPISSEDEWYEIRALLFDLYGHGVRGHARLKRLLYCSTVNRRIGTGERNPARPSYRSWGTGHMVRLLAHDTRVQKCMPSLE